MVRATSPDTVAWMLRQMNPVEAGRVGARLGAGVLSFVIDQVNPQQALETLRSLPIPRAREVSKALERPLPDADIFQHTPRTAGALMVTQFPAVHLHDRAATARDSLRTLDGMARKFTHVLFRNDDHELGGQVHMVDLALADDDTPVSSIAMSVVATVDADTTADECARLQRHYNLTQLPVVQEGRLIGVILAESLLGAVVEQGTSQMLKVASVAGRVWKTPFSVRTRLPRLTVNLATTFLAAATIALFESTLTQVVVLAAFLPVVAGQGGIGGTQTLTLIVRSIALGELVSVRARRLVAREAALGVFHGVCLGVLVAGDSNVMAAEPRPSDGAGPSHAGQHDHSGVRWPPEYRCFCAGSESTKQSRPPWWSRRSPMSSGFTIPRHRHRGYQPARLNDRSALDTMLSCCPVVLGIT